MAGDSGGIVAAEVRACFDRVEPDLGESDSGHGSPTGRSVAASGNGSRLEGSRAKRCVTQREAALQAASGHQGWPRSSGAMSWMPGGVQKAGPDSVVRPWTGPCECLGFTHEWTKSRRGVLGEQADDGQEPSAPGHDSGGAMGRHHRHDPRRESAMLSLPRNRMRSSRPSGLWGAWSGNRRAYPAADAVTHAADAPAVRRSFAALTVGAISPLQSVIL